MKQDTKWRLRDSEGKEYIIIDTEKVDIQEELNKVITKQMKEIKILKEEYMMLQNASDEVEEEKDREIERLNNIIEQTQKILYIKLMNENKEKIYIQEVIDIIENLKGSDKE